MGRETLLLWLVILIACAEKEGKKIGKSVRREMVQIQILCLPSPKLQVVHFHMPQIRPPNCPSQLLHMCPHKLNVALRLLTPVAGSLPATQPCGTTFHCSHPPTPVYVFLIRFILFIFCFIHLMVIFKGLLPHSPLLHRDHPHC